MGAHGMQTPERAGADGETALTRSTALSHVRICDLTGLLAGAGATRFLAAFGAQVIRVEQPLHEEHRWDFLRGGTLPDGRTGINLGGNFNNHNVEKLGVTLDLKNEEGKQLLARLVEISDVVTENFSAPVMERLGFGYERLRAINDQIVYVSNSGFGKPARIPTSSPSDRSCKPAAACPSCPDCPNNPLRAGASPTWTTWARTSWPRRCWPG